MEHQQPHRSIRTWAARAVLVSVALGAALLAAEAVLRLARDEDEAWRFRFRTVTSAGRQHDERYARHDRRFYAVAPDHRASPEHAGRYATDRWPWRGRPYEPAPRSLPRVAVLGDSCIYGAGLMTAQTLSGLIAADLARRGFAPDRVLVANFGVPGYSTVQMADVLDELLTGTPPDAVVLYPAAWNDQAPALLVPDAELLARLRGDSLLDALANHSRLVASLRSSFDDLDVPFDEIMSGWEAGRPPRGHRVPAGDVGTNVGAMLAACAAADVPACVVVPVHPARTLASHPRTGQDSRSVRAAGRASGVEVVDGPALLAATGRSDAHHFLDGVHPSPMALATLAEPVGRWLAGCLPDRRPNRPRPADDLAIADVEPSTTSALGDGTLQVTLDRDLDTPPTILLGGAPLLDVHAAGERRWAGTVMEDAPGPYDLLVQTAEACARRPAGVTLTEPEFRIDPGAPDVVQFVSRPGDTAQLHYAPSRRAAPRWANAGAWWLDDGAVRTVPGRFVAGEDGTASLPLPRAFSRRRPLWLQGKVAPAGSELSDGWAVRWTAPVRWEPPDR